MSDSLDLDELDDLDEFLDEFDEEPALAPSESAKSQPSIARTSVSNPESKADDPSKDSAKPKDSQSLEENEDKSNTAADDVSAQMQKGLEDLLKEIDDSPETLGEFEKLIEGFSNQLSGKDLDELAKATRNLNVDSEKPASTTNSQPGEKKSFQDTINQTMNRLNESKQEIDESVKTNADEEFLEKMLKEISGMAAEDGEGDGDVDMTKLIYELLSQVSSKEVLYEPIKELDTNFDDWLKENKPKLSAKEYENYVNQRKVAKEIVEIFEDPKYNDESTDTRKKITSKMELLQSYGSPPMDLLKNTGDGPLKELEDMGLPDLSNFDPSQMPDMENCAQQ